jgi:hypothetical protein
LRHGLSAGEAADIIYALITPDIYENLVHHRGWSAQRNQHWLGDTLCAAVLENADRSYR